jgi:ribosome assembly protein RRB1
MPRRDKQARKRQTSSVDDSEKSHPAKVDKRTNEEKGEEAAATVENLSDLEFEDDFEDEIEEDDVVSADDAASDDSDAMDREEEQLEMIENDQNFKEELKPFIPGVHQLQEGEVLEVDNAGYFAYHQLNVEWPCLSIDVLPDKLGAPRLKFPHTLYFVGGTQADQPSHNCLYLMKVSDLYKTKESEEDDEDDNDDNDDDDDDFDKDPVLTHYRLPHFGAVNRVRARVDEQGKLMLASWSDTGVVNIWSDLSEALQSLEAPQAASAALAKKAGNKGGKGKGKGRMNSPNIGASFSYSSHAAAGYGLDWSPVECKLATGDERGELRHWTPSNASWTVSAPLVGHTGSVEDIGWSPSESTVLATCSTDRTLRIWDTRMPAPAVTVTASATSDVNVLSWNDKVQHLLATGDDHGLLRVWDLRRFGSNHSSEAVVASFAWHKAPITAVQWSPYEDSVLACSSDDHTTSLWDLSVELDAEQEDMQLPSDVKVPPQLMFIHAGQHYPKDVRWHPHIPGMLLSTAQDGFNIWRPINM